MMSTSTSRRSLLSSVLVPLTSSTEDADIVNEGAAATTVQREGTPDAFYQQQLVLPRVLRGRYVTVGGMIGAGKSSLIRLLKTQFIGGGADAVLCLEETQHLKMLSLFIDDPKTHAAAFQAHMYAYNANTRCFVPMLLSRFAPELLVVQDRSTADNMVFYGTNVDEGNFTAEQQRMYETSVMRPYWLPGTASIYLYTPAHTTMLRLKRRDTKAERNYKERYIVALQRHNFWMLMFNATRTRRVHPILCVMWAYDFMDVQSNVIGPLADMFREKQQPVAVVLHRGTVAPHARNGGDDVVVSRLALYVMCAKVMHSCPGECNWIAKLVDENDGGGGDGGGDGDADSYRLAHRLADMLINQPTLPADLHLDFAGTYAFDSLFVISTTLFLMTRRGVQRLHVHNVRAPEQPVPALFDCWNRNAMADAYDADALDEADYKSSAHS